MKELALRFWNEPAVAIGALVTVGLVVLNLLGDADWSLENVIQMAAPLASGLGIRQTVKPDRPHKKVAP